MPIDTPPSPNRSASLPYLELDDRPFEELCRDLLAAQPDMDSREVELFESEGLRQYGIDVLGRGTDRSWTALSCKRYREMRPAALRRWCDDFLDHWADMWSGRPVARFILAVTVRPRSAALLDELEAQRERFRGLGVAFEAWPERYLDELLREQPDIVRRHFSPAYAEHHCGVAEAPPTGIRSDPRVLSFERNVSEDVRRLVDARERGSTRDVAELLDRLGRPVEYGQLIDADRRTYRRVAVAESLEAAGHVAAETTRARFPGEVGGDIEALIALDRAGADAALAVLDAEPGRHDGLRAQLLLAAGRFHEALGLLGDPIDPVDAGVRAKALAAVGRVEEAMAVQRAAEAVSGDASVAATGLCVRFACATAPALGTCVTSAWPEPLPDEVFRRDDETVALVREGAAIALARSCVPGASARERGDWLTWHVAFLCCDPSGRPRAGGLVREALGRGDALPGMVLWALWCDLDMDRARAIIEMERALRTDAALPEHLFALVYLLEAEGMAERARRELRTATVRFGRHRGFLEARDRWLARLGGVPDEDPFGAALRGAVADGDWEGLTRAVNDPVPTPAEGGRRLVLAGRVMARYGRFAELEGMADRLVAEIGTADAIELAARGWAGTGHWDRVAVALASTEPFPDGRLPPGAASLLAEARARTGDVTGSLAIRRGLLGTAADPQGVTLARSLLDVGDIGGAASIASGVELAALSPHEVVSAIAIARIADPAAARSLLERALDLPQVPDALLPHLVEQGYALGLDRRVGPILAEAVADSRIEGRSLSLEELAEHMSETRRHADELNDAHRRGELPIALFAEAVRLDTTELVLGGRHVGADPILLAQHGGGRTAALAAAMDSSPPPERPRRLALDVPALLLAHRYGFLLELRRTFGPLLLPDSLVVSLAEAIARAAPHQASMAQARRRVGDAIDAGTVQVGDGECDLAVGDPEEGADLSFEMFVAEVAAGARHARDGERRATVCFGPGGIERLAASDVWEEALDGYELTATSEERDRITAELRGDGLDADRRGSVSRLVGEVSAGIRDGRYEIMGHRGSSVPPEAVARSSDEAAVLSLLASRFPDGCALFSGDRCLNGFVSVDQTPIASVTTVLDWMREAGILSAARRRAISGAMRRANVHFLPVEPDDLMRALLQASVDGQVLLETDELRSFRRHAAFETLLQPHWRLDESTGVDGQGVELSIVRDSVLVVGECLRRLWLGDGADDERVARADWVVESLLTDRLERVPLAGGDGGKVAWFAMVVGRLYGAAFEAGPRGLERAGHLVGWVDSRLVGRWATESVPFRDNVVATLAPLVGIMTNDDAFPEGVPLGVRDAYRARVSQVVELLPRTIADELTDRMPELRRRRGTLYTVVGDCGIVPADFDRAIRVASVDGASEVTIRSGPHPGAGIVGRRDAELGLFEIVLPDGRIPVGDLRLALVSRFATGRPAVDPDAGLGELEAAWIDSVRVSSCSGLREADSIIAGSYSLRMSHAERALESGSLPADAVRPPSPMVFDRHLDVADGRGDVADWLASQVGAAAGELSASSCARMRRLLHLPVDFGAGARDAFASLGPAALEGIVASLASEAFGPVPRSHLLNWLGGADPILGPDPATLEDCEALTSLFRWTWRVTERETEWRTLTMSWRILYCWYHASRVSTLFARAGLDPAEVRQTVDGWDPAGVASAVLPVHDAGREVAGPDAAAGAVHLALFLHGCPEPDERQLAIVLETIVIRVGDRAYPQTSVVEGRHMPDAIGSLLSSTRRTPPAWLTEMSAWLDPEAVETGIVRDPPWAAENRKQPRAWTAYLHMRRRHLPAAESRSVIAAWREIDVASRISNDPEWVTALTMLCSLRGQLDPDDRDWLAALLDGLFRSEMGGVSDERRLEAAVRFLVRAGEVDDVGGFVRDAERIDRFLRRHARDAVSILVRLARELGPVAASGIWERAVSLRAA